MCTTLLQDCVDENPRTNLTWTSSYDNFVFIPFLNRRYFHGILYAGYILCSFLVTCILPLGNDRSTLMKTGSNLTFHRQIKVTLYIIQVHREPVGLIIKKQAGIRSAWNIMLTSEATLKAFVRVRFE